MDNRDKAIVDDHTLQLDGNEYVVVGPKSMPKSNGCAPNRITITANPLADADNKVRYILFLFLSFFSLSMKCADGLIQNRSKPLLSDKIYAGLG